MSRPTLPNSDEPKLTSLDYAPEMPSRGISYVYIAGVIVIWIALIGAQSAWPHTTNLDVLKDEISFFQRATSGAAR